MFFKTDNLKKIKKILKQDRHLYSVTDNYNNFLKSYNVYSLNDIENNVKLFLNLKYDDPSWKELKNEFEKCIKNNIEINFGSFSIIWLKNNKIVYPVIKGREVNVSKTFYLDENENNKKFNNLIPIVKKMIFDILNQENIFLLADGLLIYKQKEDVFKVFFNEKVVKII
ncbi:MSC_0623 family F1-like ATPase-associated protein [Mesomycoplasma lagogenitalium]|uniref:DUF2714 domain-containing protein n=1 Tax=Mesomycoplasma lagogenitalium TaxID=171286 RepID=A0ABY8LUW9_9BACT|nr:DUF2714 domain-containing protein [Mesomycoplasma lagogenitalium]WGI37028.1 DUF2714 domain-containing protein [Mesomycoplasma lagogenitalium]